MRAWLLVAATACHATASSEGTGTVAYSEQGTGNVMTVDVATGDATTIDVGDFVAISIAPDGQHVAYSAIDDGIMRVADRAGNVSMLTSGCNVPATWIASDALLYCTENGSTAIVGLGAPAREIAAASFLVAWTSGGRQLVYVSTQGDLVVENRDGSQQRVLMSATNIQQLAVAPDDAHVVVVGLPDAMLHVVALDGSGDRSLGPATSLATPIGDAPRFSPSGGEVLAVDPAGLFAADLESGAQRPLVAVPNAGGMPAAFLDDARTISEHFGAQRFEIEISGGAKDVAIESSTGSSQCGVVDVAIDAQIAAVECAIPAIIDFDGNTLTGHIAESVLGLSADRGGMITVTSAGQIDYARLDGTSKQLAVTSESGQILPNVPAPPRVLAAYAP